MQQGEGNSVLLPSSSRITHRRSDTEFSVPYNYQKAVAMNTDTVGARRI